jgi:hypothetical protein
MIEVQDLGTSSQLVLSFDTTNPYSEEFYNDGQNAKNWGFTGFTVHTVNGDWDASRSIGLEVSLDGVIWVKYYSEGVRVVVPMLTTAGAFVAPASVVGAGAYPRVRLVSLNSGTLADAAQTSALTVTVVLWR